MSSALPVWDQLTPESTYYFANLLRSGACFSLPSSLAILFVYFLYIRRYRPEHDTFNTRLIVHTSVYDLMLSLGLIFIIDLTPTSSEVLCRFLMFLQIGGYVGGSLVPMVLAFNVQEILIRGKEMPKTITKWANLACFVITMILSLSPMEVYGFDPDLQYCWYKNSITSTSTLAWMLLSFYIPCMIGLIYNTFVFGWAAVIVYRHSNKKYGGSSTAGAVTMNKKAEDKKKRAILRLVTFPLIILIVQFPSMSYQIQGWALGEYGWTLLFLNQLTGGVQGFLYAIAYFGLDPVFQGFRQKYLKFNLLSEEDGGNPETSTAQEKTIVSDGGQASNNFVKTAPYDEGASVTGKNNKRNENAV